MTSKPPAAGPGALFCAAVARKSFWLVLALGLAALAPSAAAEDANAGRQKAIKCKQCHGLDGIGKVPIYPHIAGQQKEYLIKSMRDFRDGVRQDPMMSFIASELSDEDIADLAAYYSAIEIEIKVPAE